MTFVLLEYVRARWYRARRYIKCTVLPGVIHLALQAQQGIVTTCTGFQQVIKAYLGLVKTCKGPQQAIQAYQGFILTYTDLQQALKAEQGLVNTFTGPQQEEQT